MRGNGDRVAGGQPHVQDPQRAGCGQVERMRADLRELLPHVIVTITFCHCQHVVRAVREPPPPAGQSRAHACPGHRVTQQDIDHRVPQDERIDDLAGTSDHPDRDRRGPAVRGDDQIFQYRKAAFPDRPGTLGNRPTGFVRTSSGAAGSGRPGTVLDGAAPAGACSDQAGRHRRYGRSGSRGGDHGRGRSREQRGSPHFVGVDVHILLLPARPSRSGERCSGECPHDRSPRSPVSDSPGPLM